MRRTLLLLAVLASLTGCTSGETWSAVEVERRRILTELKKELPADQHDRLTVIVMDRPRTKPDSMVSGYQHAVTRVKRERLALEESRVDHRLFVKNYEEGRGNSTDGKKAREWNEQFDRWQGDIARAEQLLLIADAIHEIEELMPVFDHLVHQEFRNSRAGIQPRAIPASDTLRLHRATEWFTDWQKRFWAATPLEAKRYWASQLGQEAKAP